jgi:malonyl-CoA O-methyltransferase
MFNLINQIQKAVDQRSSLEKALAWVYNHRIRESGVVVHHQTKNVTPEVTGYLITSLYNSGEKEFAFDLTRWELKIQKKDGSFAAPGIEISYTFDTAQVIRGFLTVANDMPEVKPAIFKACDYMLTQIDEKGEIHTPSEDMWNLPNGGKLSKYCNLFCIAPLLEAGKKFNQSLYVKAAQQSLNFYKNKKDITEFKPELGTLSHIFGYMMEALAELGEQELAQKGLEQALKIQKIDGAIPAYPGAEWVCSTGMAQLGLAWFKIGNHAKAQEMLHYLEKIQNASGGFYGGYGKNVQYFDKQEISWANKFFIDLYLLVKGKNV